MRLLIIFLLLAMNVQAQKVNLDFLEGTWKVTDKEVYERWTKLGDKTFKGEGFMLKDGNKKVAEILDINDQSGKLTYYATVMGQNDNMPIAFKYNKTEKDVFSFENPNHDFPKKIVYKKISDSELFITVIGKPGEQFDFTMIKEISEDELLLPEWLEQDFENIVGVWKTDNSAYKTETEPFEAYGMTWEEAEDGNGVTGILYGFQDSEQSENFWSFKRYWDKENKLAVVEQDSPNGVSGKGTFIDLEGMIIEEVQTFTMPDGRTWEEKHLSSFNENGELSTTSFEKDVNGIWQEKRTYIWVKQ